MARKKAADAAGRKAAGDGLEGEQLAELPFEGALEQLEATARRLEAGDLPLEEALALFETGIALSRRCTETLEAAERRVEILVAERDGQTASSERFDVADLEDDDDFEDGFDEEDEDEEDEDVDPDG